MMRRKFISLIGVLAVAVTLSYGGAPSYYPPSIGEYNGSTDLLRRTSDLSGNVNGKVGIASGWIRVDGGDTTQRAIYCASGYRFYVNLMGAGDSWANELWVRAYDVVGTEHLRLRTVSSILAGTGWHHFLASWNVGTGESHLYIDDVLDLYEETNTDAVLDYTRNVHEIGRITGVSAGHFNGAIAELYINLAEYIDFSIEANRRLFIDSNGNPVDLGPSGYKPTGTAPIVYMRTPYNNAGLNSGTGGDFTINGSPSYTMGPVPFPITTWAPGASRGLGGRGGRSFIQN